MKGAFVLFLLFSASSTSFGQVDESAPAMMLPSPEKRLRFSRVVIMHNDRPNRHIRFMFEPLVRTLLAGFAHYRVPVAFVIVEAYKCKGPCMRKHFHRVKPGEMLLWIGHPGRVEIPWKYLRDKDVYTVYYQSEPRTDMSAAPCAVNASTVDEMWDYSWFNIDRCGGGLEHPQATATATTATDTTTLLSLATAGRAREEARAAFRKASDAPTLRHVPPGALPPSAKANDYT